MIKQFFKIHEDPPSATATEEATHPTMRERRRPDSMRRASAVCHVWPSSGESWHQHRCRDLTVGNTHWSGYPSHHKMRERTDKCGHLSPKFSHTTCELSSSQNHHFVKSTMKHLLSVSLQSRRDVLLSTYTDDSWAEVIEYTSDTDGNIRSPFFRLA